MQDQKPFSILDHGFDRIALRDSVIAIDESIPLLVYESKYGSWRSPETRRSMSQCAPTGPPSGDIASGTRQTPLRLAAWHHFFDPSAAIFLDLPDPLRE